MGALIRVAWLRAIAHRARAIVAFLGIGTVGVMVGLSVTVAYDLHGGFQRAAQRADLPDAVASFQPVPLGSARSRVEALPDLAAESYRLVQTSAHVADLTPTHRSFGRGGPRTGDGVVEGVLPGRRGYAVVAGRDLSGRPGEVVVERGLQQQWHLRIGDRLDLRGFGPVFGPDAFRVVGVAVSPDNVAYPLANGPRLYIPYEDARRLYFQLDHAPVNRVLIWAKNPDQLPVMLEQARLATFRLADLQVVSRDGYRVLIDGAAGIVVSLLVAFSVVAACSAALLLAASAYADVQRRSVSLGTVRAIGASRRQVVGGAAVEATLVAVPAAAVGVAVGWLAAVRPTGRVLEALNEFPSGSGIVIALLAAVAALVGLVVAATVWPAWRLARRTPSALLRRGDIASSPRARWLPAGWIGVGMRMAVARPARATATVAVIAAAVSVILLLMSLASLLDRLQHDPAAAARRYQLSVSAPRGALPAIRTVPGVASAVPRYQVDAVDSFQLGESFQLIAYPGDVTRFESPPLLAGRRLRSEREVDVGAGLATALGLHVGSTLAAQLPSGREVRLLVAGIVAVAQNDGRIGYLRPARLLAAYPGAPGSIAVSIAPGSTTAGVRRSLEQRGFVTSTTGAVTTRNAGFLALLAALLRTVALVDAFVCLYALVQSLTITAVERGSAVATLRACGAGRREIGAVFFGAALVILLAALPVAAAAERLVLGPQAARLAAGYAALDLVASGRLIILVVVGMFALAMAAAAHVTRRALRTPIAAQLRSQ